MKKTIIMLAALAVITLSATAQSYTVAGTVPDGIGMIYMRHLFSGQIDTVAVTGGTFRFTGETDGKYIFAEVFHDWKDGAYVVLDGDVTVDIVNHEAHGTEENDALTPWAKCYRILEMREHQLNEVLPVEVPELESWNTAQFEQLVDDMLDFTIECCKANPRHIFPALYLVAAQGAWSDSRFVELLESGAAYTQLPLTKYTKEKVAAQKKNK